MNEGNTPASHTPNTTSIHLQAKPERNIPFLIEYDSISRDKIIFRSHIEVLQHLLFLEVVISLLDDVVEGVVYMSELYSLVHLFD